MFIEILENYHRNYLQSLSKFKEENQIRCYRVLEDLKRFKLLAKNNNSQLFTNPLHEMWLKDKISNPDPFLKQRILEIYEQYSNIIQILGDKI
jgi:hypothetical protein